MLWRPLELHVLQQVGHPGLPISLVSRADEVRDVHSRLRLGFVREEKHTQAIAESILGDAFDADRSHWGRAGCRGLCNGC